MNILGGFGYVPCDLLMPAVVPQGFNFSCCWPMPSLRAAPLRDAGVQDLAGVGTQHQMAAANINARIQYTLHPRLDRGHLKVTRSVKCDACDIMLNSEQQARQHYKGKFHQRKIRQQSQRSVGTPPDAAAAAAAAAVPPTPYANKPTRGVKRSLVAASKNAGKKRFRRDTEDATDAESSVMLDRRSSISDDAIVPETKTSEDTVSVTIEKVDGGCHGNVKSEVENENDARECTTKRSEEKARESEVELKKLQERSSRDAISFLTLQSQSQSTLPPAQKAQEISIPSRPTGKFVGLLSWQPQISGVKRSWLPPSIAPALQSIVTPRLCIPTQHTISFNADLRGARSSIGGVISGYAAPQPLLKAEVLQTAGLARNTPEVGYSLLAPVSILGGSVASIRPSFDAGNTAAIHIQKEPEVTSLNPGSSILRHFPKRNVGFDNATRSSWQRRPDLNQSQSQSNRLASDYLDRLDPVSRAVYNNFLGHFSTKRSRSKYGRPG